MARSFTSGSERGAPQRPGITRAAQRAVSILFCVLVLAAAKPSQASLDPDKPISQYLHQSWQAGQGLPQDSVLALTQTPDGFVWLGTEEGLVRFDGLHFTLFDKSTPGLKNSMVLALLVDHTNDLWLGTYGGGIARLHNGKFQSFTTKEGLPSNLVKALYEDQNGTIWIGTDGGGLASLKDGRFRTYTEADGLESNTVFSIAGDRSGALWIGTQKGVDRLSGGVIRAVPALPGTDGRIVRAIQLDDDGTAWIGTGDGLLKVSSLSRQVFRVQDGLKSNTIFSIKRDSAGTLWVGTANGISRYARGKFSGYSQKEGLRGKDVWTIFDDREGNLWVGTGGGGLNCFRSSPFTNLSKEEGLTSDLILTIFQDRTSGMWLGSDQGLMNVKDGRVTTFTTKEGLPDNLVFSVSQDREGTIWVGTRRGLGKVTGQKILPANFLPKTSVICTFTDRNGELWVGTRNGLSHITGTAVKTYTTADGLSNNNVLAIYQDGRGVMWVGTGGGGLNRFEAGHFSSLTTHEGLASDVVWSLFGEPDGTLWAGTSGGGLARYRGGKFTNYGLKSGLGDDSVLGILGDRQGNLWLGSDKGVFRVSKQELNAYAEGQISRIRPRVYGMADGMRSGECNGGFQPAAARSSDGKLWFPTMRGAVIVDPDSIREGQMPHAVLDGALIDDQEIGLQQVTAAAPGRGKLEFHFTAPTQVNPQAVEFRYMLEGFDKGWSDAGTRRSAFYTNIPPGEYRFRVEAGRENRWSEQEASLPISLQPHLYQTKLFLFFLVVAGGSLCWVAYRVRVRQLKRNERRLEDLVDQRTAALAQSEMLLRKSRDELEGRVQERTQELVQSNRALEDEIAVRRCAEEQLTHAKEAAEAASRAKSEFLTNMSHEIRTPINGIIGMTDITLGTDLEEDQREYLEVVKLSADSLLAIVNDILDFSKIETKKLSLDWNPFALRACIEEVAELQESRARQKGLDFVCEIAEVIPDQVVGDGQRFRQVILNLLDNAVKFTSKGSVRLAVAQDWSVRDGVRLQISVSDTGIGISAEKQKTIFDAFSQADTSSTRRYGGTGLGLAISSQLVSMMKGTLWVESEVGVGTTFHFTAELRSKETTLPLRTSGEPSLSDLAA